MNYHNITHDDMLNGYGIRVVLWVSGCEHHCKECQNPITWDINNGLLFDDLAKSELFESLERDYVSGVTISGGDPLHIENREEVLQLCKDIKKEFKNKDIWIYTGYKFEEISNLKGFENIDVLVDGKFEINLKDNLLNWKGSSNQRVIDVKKSLFSGNINIIE